MEAAGPAFAKASQNAKKNGAIYGRLFSSTPKYLGHIKAILYENLFNCWELSMRQSAANTLLYFI